jgi:uncharacterized protein YjdB
MRRLRLVALVAVFSVASVLSCVDGSAPVGPDTLTPVASLALVPVFPKEAQGIESAPINLIRLTAREVPSEVVVAQVITTVDPNASQWELGIDVPLDGGAGVQYVLEIELVNRTGSVETVQWSGRTAPLALTPGTSLETREVAVLRGPLDNLSVTAVVIEGPSQVAEQEPFTLRALVQTSQAGTQPAVFWTALDPAIATMGSDGQGQALRAGTARIQAQAGAVTVTHTITVTPVPTTVQVTPASAELTAAGQVAQFSASVRDRSGTAIPGAQVTWSVADDRIVESLGGGQFRARGAGSTTVTATAVANPALSASAGVVVRLTPVEVVVSPASATLNLVGQTTQLTAQLFAAGRVPVFGVGVTWSSSNAGVVSVDANGQVTALSAGEATITATTTGAPSLQGSATVTVVLPPVVVRLSPPATTLTSVGQQVTLAAQAFDAVGGLVPSPTLTWSSSNPVAATVSALGVVTAVADGTSIITAATGGVSGTATVTVDVVVGSVTVSPASFTLSAPGRQQALTAVVASPSGTPIPGATPTWSSSNPAAATVSAQGVVTAVADGTSVITATVKGVSGSATATVNVAVASVQVEPAGATMTAIGQQYAYTAVALNSDGAEIPGQTMVWSSSNPAVATVDAAGLVTAVADGTTQIGATTKGVTGRTTLTVDLAVASVQVQPASATLSAGVGMQFTAAAFDAAGRVLPVTFEWASSNPLIATVAPDGFVTAVEPGSTFVVAVAKGTQGSATLTVQGALSPVASFFETPGNTELVTGSYPRPSTAHYFRPTNAVSATPGLTVISTGTFASDQGGVVDMEADGDFSYTPPLGFVGTDQFTFTAASDETATVEIEVIGRIWYVSDGGSGTGLSNDGLPGASGTIGAPGDVIYVYAPEDSYVDGGLVMQDGQQFIGEGVGLDLSPWGVLHPAGFTPEVTTASGAGVTLADDVFVTGLVFYGTDDGIYGSGVSNATVEDVRIMASANNGVGLDDPTGTFTFNDLRIDGAGQYGFLVSGGDADIEVNLGADPGILNAVRHVVRIENTLGGQVVFNGGAIHSQDGRGFKILAAAGDVIVNSPVQVLNPANDGLSVQNTPGHVYLADFTTTVTGRSGIHLLNNSGMVEVGTGTVQTTDAPGLDIVDALMDLNLTSVMVNNTAGSDGLLIQNAPGMTRIGLLGITHGGGGTALNLLNAGTFEVTNPASSVTSTGYQAFDLFDTYVLAEFGSVVSTNSVSQGMDMGNLVGSINILGGTIANAAADGIRLQSSGVDFYFNGSVVDPGGNAVVLNALSGGQVQFNGVQSNGGGIVLTGNTGAIMRFAGLDLQTGANNAFVATGGGTVEVTGTGNRIATTTGQAVVITATDIGPGDVVLESVSADGTSVAVNLNTTGAAGSFKVTGTGSPGSGGTIQNTTNNGMLVFNTVGLELRNMLFSNTGTHSIGGGGLTDFTFDGLQIVNSGFRGFALSTTTGAGSITNTVVSGSANPSMLSTNAGPLVLAVDNSSFTGTTGSAIEGALDLAVSGSGSLDAALDGVTITGNSNRGVRFTATGGSTGALRITSSVFATNAGDHVSVLADGTSLVEFVVSAGSTLDQGSMAGVSLTTTSSGRIKAEVSGNTFTSLSGDGVQMSSSGTSALDARVFDNQVSGSGSGAGVWGVADGASTMNAWVAWNDVAGTTAGGIFLEAGLSGGSTASGNFQVSDNTVDFTGAYAPIAIKQSQSAQMCVSVTGNETSSGASEGIGLTQLAGVTNSLKVERLNNGSGAVASVGVIEGYLGDVNPDAPYVAADVVNSFDGVPTGTCLGPVAPVGGTNAGPVAHPQRVMTDGTTPVVVTLTGADPDGSGLTFSVVTPPSAGSLGGITPTGSNTAQVIYTPAGPGIDPFTFRVSDGVYVADAAVVTDNAAPTLQDIAYTTAGNTELVAGGYSSPWGSAYVEDPANVFDPTPGASADNAGPFATTAGGQVTLAADGSFSYRPPRGFNGDDTFPVTVGAATATVTVTVTDMVWYVDNREDGSGRSHSAYPTLTDAAIASGPGETIFIWQGDGSTNGLDYGIELQPGQRLLGEAAGLSVPGVGVIVAPGGFRPKLTNLGFASTVGLGNLGPADNFIMGLEIDGETGPAIEGVELGITVVDDVVITDRGDGVQLTAATGSITFTDTDITGVDADPFVVDGGSPDIDFTGSITADIGAVLLVSNTTGGTMTFTGSFTGMGEGVTAFNAAGTVEMTGLHIVASSYKGIYINGSTGTFTFNDVDMTGVSQRPVWIQDGSPTVTVNVNAGGIDNASDELLRVAGTTGGSVTLTGGPITDTGDGVLIDTNEGSVSVANSLSITSNSGGVQMVGSNGPVTFSDLTVVTTGFSALVHSAGTGMLTVSSGSIDATDAAGLSVNSPVDLNLSSVSVTSDNTDEAVVFMGLTPTSYTVIGTLTLDSPSGSIPLELDDAGYFEVADGTINSGDHPAIDIVATNLSVGLTSLTATPTSGQAVSIANSNGWFSADGGLIQNANAGAVSLVGNSDLDFFFGGTIDNTAGPAVLASGNSAEASTFSFGGPINDTGQGIQIISNGPGVQIDFTGNLNVTTTNLPAILATGVNVIRATGASNLLTSVNAPAVVLTDTRSVTLENLTSSAGSNPALAIAQATGNGTVTVTNAGFTGNASGPTLLASTSGTASLDLSMSGLNVTGASSGPGFSGTAQSTSDLNLTIDGVSVFDNNDTGIHLVTADDATIKFLIDGNQILNSKVRGVAVESASLGGTAEGVIRNNTITDFESDGVLVRTLAGGVATVDVVNNTVSTNYALSPTQGIAARAGTGIADSGDLHVAVMNNLVAVGAGGFGLDLQSHGTALMCTNVQANAITDPSGLGAFGFGAWQAESSTFQLERFTGTPTLVGDVQAHIAAENPAIAPFAGGTGPVAIFIDSGGFAPVTNGFCRIPAP